MSEIFERSPDVLAAHVGDETVILDQRAEIYLGLRGVGPMIWEFLESPTSSEEIVERVSDECSIDPEVCQEDVIAFLGQLEAAGLIRASRK